MKIKKSFKINFHLFEKCNMNCSYCFRDKKDQNYKIKDLDQYLKIINKLHELGIKYINFAGGEPTLFKDIPELLEYSKNKGIKNSIISNATLFNKDSEFIKKVIRNLDIFGISIDSLDNEINEKIGRIFNNKNFVGINEVLMLYENCKSNNVKFKINTVITKFNINDDSIFEIFEKGFIPYRMKVMMVHKPKYLNNDVFNLKYKVTEEKLKNKFEKFKSYCGNRVVCENGNSMENSYLMVDGLGNLSTSSICANAKIINILESSEIEIEDFILKNLDIKKYNDRY